MMKATNVVIPIIIFTTFLLILPTFAYVAEFQGGEYSQMIKEYLDGRFGNANIIKEKLNTERNKLDKLSFALESSEAQVKEETCNLLLNVCATEAEIKTKFGKKAKQVSAQASGLLKLLNHLKQNNESPDDDLSVLSTDAWARGQADAEIAAALKLPAWRDAVGKERLMRELYFVDDYETASALLVLMQTLQAERSEIEAVEKLLNESSCAICVGEKCTEETKCAARKKALDKMVNLMLGGVNPKEVFEKNAAEADELPAVAAIKNALTKNKEKRQITEEALNAIVAEYEKIYDGNASVYLDKEHVEKFAPEKRRGYGMKAVFGYARICRKFAEGAACGKGREMAKKIVGEKEAEGFWTKVYNATDDKNISPVSVAVALVSEAVGGVTKTEVVDILLDEEFTTALKGLTKLDEEIPPDCKPKDKELGDVEEVAKKILFSEKGNLVAYLSGAITPDDKLLWQVISSPIRNASALLRAFWKIYEKRDCVKEDELETEGEISARVNNSIYVQISKAEQGAVCTTLNGMIRELEERELVDKDNPLIPSALQKLGNLQRAAC